MTKNEAMAHKNLIRYEKAIKALRKQLRYSMNIIRVDMILSKDERAEFVKQSKTVMDETERYWSTIPLTMEEIANWNVEAS